MIEDSQPPIAAWQKIELQVDSLGTFDHQGQRFELFAEYGGEAVQYFAVLEVGEQASLVEDIAIIDGLLSQFQAAQARQRIYLQRGDALPEPYVVIEAASFEGQEILLVASETEIGEGTVYPVYSDGDHWTSLTDEPAFSRLVKQLSGEARPTLPQLPQLPGLPKLPQLPSLKLPTREPDLADMAQPSIPGDGGVVILHDEAGKVFEIERAGHAVLDGQVYYLGYLKGNPVIPVALALEDGLWTLVLDDEVLVKINRHLNDPDEIRRQKTAALIKAAAQFNRPFI